MKKRALRIGMIFAVLVMLFMLPCMADSANAETKEFESIQMSLEPGNFVIPIHGMDIYDFHRNLDFYPLQGEECPIDMIAMKQWYVWDDTTNKYELAGVNDYVGDTFDCYKTYKCRLQVRMPAKDGDTDLRFSEDAYLRLHNYGFTFVSQSVVGDHVQAYFELMGISPRYIRVKGIEINEDNMNDVLGDEDVGSTVYYDSFHNVLILNNADLVFDEKSVAPVLNNPGDYPYMIYALNNDLSIRVIGNNRISAAERQITDYWQLAGIFLDYIDEVRKGTLRIWYDGTLEIDLDGNDTSNSKKYLHGILAPSVDIYSTKITVNGKNGQVFNGITCNDKVSYSNIECADITVSDENISDVSVGIFCGADKERGLYIDESKIKLNQVSIQAIGIMCEKVILRSWSKLSITADGADGTAFRTDLLDLTENYDNTALVNMTGSEVGRTIWDGETNLCNSYKYIRMPGLEYTWAKEPTATESGNIAYYYDDLYNKYFADAEGNQELSESEIIIPPTGPSEEEMERAAALTDLNNAVSDAKAVGNADGKYTDDSYQALQTAITSAEALAANENATTEELKAAKDAVEAAKTGLKEKSSGTDPVGPTPEDPDDPKPVDPTPTPVPVVTPTAPTEPAEMIILSALKISKPAPAKKAVTVKWKKVSKKNQKKIQGIEIQVATDPDFTNIVKTATAGKKKTSKKIKGLTSKQTYYVRIRAYKDTAEGKHVSLWKSKKVKIK